MRETREHLESLVGGIAKVDARRLGVETEEFECQEDDSDEHLLSTCIAVDVFARSVCGMLV